MGPNRLADLGRRHGYRNNRHDDLPGAKNATPAIFARFVITWITQGLARHAVDRAGRACQDVGLGQGSAGVSVLPLSPAPVRMFDSWRVDQHKGDTTRL